jgi:DNA-binding NtrC family response regulator
VLIVAPHGCDAAGLARTLHALTQPEAPFVLVDCAETPDVERALFGTVRPRNGRADLLETVAPDGRLAEARGGTLVLLAIHELPANTQARLSRLLRDGEVRAAAGGRRMPLDTRLVACTELSLQREVQHGCFRADLLRRFVSAQLELTPLSQRREDIGPLATALMQHAAQELGRTPREFSEASLALLAALEWDGNTAELARVVRALAAAGAGRVRVEDVVAGMNPGSLTGVAVPRVSLREARRQFERDYIAAVLRHSGWRMGQAARVLGIQRPNLYRKARQLGIARAKAGE